MSDTRQKLVVEILGSSDGLVKAFEGGGISAEGFAEKLKSSGGVAAVGVASLIGVGVGLVDIGEKFKSAYNTISVTTGATGPKLDELEKSFKNVFSTVPTNMADASVALAGLNQTLGLSGKPLEEMTEQLLTLSRVTKTDVKENVQAATTVFNNWGISVKEQPEFLNQMFRASQATGVSVATLMSTMAGSGAKLREAGLDWEHSAALIATLSKNGIDAATVMAPLGKAIAAAAKHGEDAGTVITKAFADIKGESETLGNNEALKLFGTKGIAMAGMIREGKLSVDDLVKSMADGKETIEAAGERTETLAQHFQVLKNKALVGIEPLATGLLVAIEKGMDAALPKLKQFSDWWGTHIQPSIQLVAGVIQRDLVPILVTLGGWLLSVAAMVSRNSDLLEAGAIVVGIIAAVIIASFVPAMIVWTINAGLAAAATLLALAPIALVVAAIVGLAYVIVHNWDTIKEAFSTAINWVANFVTDHWPLILAVITGGLSVAIQFVVDHFTDVVDFVKGLPGKISSAASGMWDGITGAFKGAINAIIRMWDSLHFKIPGFHIGPVGYDGFELGVPNIPQFDMGGIVQGPRGSAQLIMAHAGETVLPTHKPGYVGGGATYLFPNFVGDRTELTREIDRNERRKKATMTTQIRRT